MDFELSEDQLALRKAAADLLDALASTERVRQVGEGSEHIDHQLWQAMSEQGWPAVELDESAGGLGLGAVEVAVLGEEIGRHVAPVPFLGTVAVAGALARSLAGGAPAEQALGGVSLSDWVQRLASGEAVGVVAWPAQLGAVVASQSGGSWSGSGSTGPVVYGPSADIVLVPADSAGGPGLLAVVPARPDPEPAMDRTRSVGRFSFDSAPAFRLGGAEALQQLLDRVNTALCAEMLGAADRVLTMSVEYAKDRVQFGRPIGSFQAVKHRCADMLVDVEGMRSATYYAAWAVGAADPDASAAASAAKIWCADASRRVMASGLQVHGGIGFTWEHDLHLFVKRSQLDQVTFGDARYHRDRLAGFLRPKAEAGLPVL